MKTHKTILFFSTVCSLLIFGCPYEAKFPLSNPSDSVIDTNYIGFWESIDKTSAQAFSGVNINAFNEHEYFIEMMMKAKSGLMLQNFRAFSTTINNQKFLSIQEIGSKPTFNFYKYSLANDTLKVAAISDNVLKKQLNNKEELISFIQKNINDSNFFVEEQTFIKKKK